MIPSVMDIALEKSNFNWETIDYYLGQNLIAVTYLI